MNGFIELSSATFISHPQPTHLSENSSDLFPIHSAEDLLKAYQTLDPSPEMDKLLKSLRDTYIDDIDNIDSSIIIHKLMAWLLDDYELDSRGESLESLADRLGDIDIESDSDRYTDLIFHLKDAVERLYELEVL